MKRLWNILWMPVAVSMMVVPIVAGVRLNRRINQQPHPVIHLMPGSVTIMPLTNMMGQTNGFVVRVELVSIKL